MDARTWTLLLNTLLLAGATCAISLPLGSLLAWLLARTDLPGRKAGIAALGLMLFVPLYLQAAAWQAGLGVMGWVTQASGAPPLLAGWSGAIWVHSMAALPWVVLIVGVALRLVEPELEEQALLDGSSWQVVRQVTLRSAVPAVAVAALWVAIVTAGEITVTDLFMVRTYAEELYTRIAVGPQPGDPPLGWQPGVILTAALLIAVLLACARLLPADRPISWQRRWVFRLGPWRLPVAVLVALVFVLLWGVPLVNLLCKAGVLVTPTDAGRLRTWSPGQCLGVVASSPWRYRREFGWSLGIGALAATAAVAVAIGLIWLARGGRHRVLQGLLLAVVCLWLLGIGTGVAAAAAVLAVVLAWFATGSRRWAVPALVASICLALPGPVVGIRIIRLLNRPEIPLLVWMYDQSILAPWLALVIRSLPLATLVVWQALRTIPQEMLESGAVDGAGPLRRLWSIALPCRLSAVALAWVVALAVALGDLGASILVVPPGVTTVSIRVFGLLHAGQEPEVAGICLALIGLLAAVALVAASLLGRWCHPGAAE